MSGREALDVNGQHAAAVVLRMAEVKPEPVRWLWPGRFPLGRLSEVSGDPGLGKSTLLYDLAARVTRGDAMPDGSPGPGPAGVLILSAEDDLASVIRPRLEAAGADLGRVGVLRLRDADGELREPTLADLAELEWAGRELGALLVIVDPLMDYLPRDVDAHRDQDVRRPLAALRALAERLGAAVVIVRHLNKSQSESPLYRPGGSIGITATMRAGHLLAADPAGGALVLAPTKSSLAPMPKPLRLRLVTDPGSTFARVSWEGECEHSAASLLAPPPTPEDRSAVEEADEFLRELLAAGPVLSREAESEAKSAGLKLATVRRARERLGIVPRKAGRPGEPGQHWTWALPEDAQPSGEPAPKMLNGAESEHLREGEPGASTCEHGASEDAHTGECEQVREGAAKASSTREVEHLRKHEHGNSVSAADVAEGAHEGRVWASSESAPGTVEHLRRSEKVPGA